MAAKTEMELLRSIAQTYNDQGQRMLALMAQIEKRHMETREGPAGESQRGGPSTTALMPSRADMQAAQLAVERRIMAETPRLSPSPTPSSEPTPAALESSCAHSWTDQWGDFRAEAWDYKKLLSPIPIGWCELCGALNLPERILVPAAALPPSTSVKPPSSSSAAMPATERESSSVEAGIPGEEAAPVMDSERDHLFECLWGNSYHRGRSSGETYCPCWCHGPDETPGPTARDEGTVVWGDEPDLWGNRHGVGNATSLATPPTASESGGGETTLDRTFRRVRQEFETWPEWKKHDFWRLYQPESSSEGEGR